jgi:cellulase/cellobiase CelA1
VNLRWTAASDPDGLACYQVYEDYNGTQIKVATFGPDVTSGMVVVNYPPYGTPSRVASIYVVALDRWGAISQPSGRANVTVYNDYIPPPSPTPSPTPSGLCQVTYTSHAWNSGMTVSVSIKNTGTTPIARWRLTFAFPHTGQRYSSGWGADWMQTGTAVTANALSYNHTIPPGGGLTIGFNGTHQGTNPSPTTFQLNDTICR